MPAPYYLTCPRCPRLAPRSACADHAAARAVPALASRRRGDARTLLLDVPAGARADKWQFQRRPLSSHEDEAMPASYDLRRRRRCRRWRQGNFDCRYEQSSTLHPHHAHVPQVKHPSSAWAPGRTENAPAGYSWTIWILSWNWKTPGQAYSYFT